MKDFLSAELKKIIEQQKDKLTAEEYQQEIELIDAIDWPIKSKINEVHMGSMIKLEMGERAQWYLLSPTVGGNFIMADQGPLLIVSAFSSLGQELMGRKIGDTFTLQNKSFRILELQ